MIPPCKVEMLKLCYNYGIDSDILCKLWNPICMLLRDIDDNLHVHCTHICTIYITVSIYIDVL